MKEINSMSKDICQRIKSLRQKKGYSLEDIGNMLFVTKQGFHMWEQGLRAWKLDTLAMLSKILGFKIVIEDGEIKFSEKKPNKIKEKKEVYNMIGNILENQTTEMNRYEIISLYTGADNIDFEYKEILDDALLYTDKEEARDAFNTDTLVPVFALFDNEEGRMISNSYGLDKQVAYSKYYWRYAPVIDNENTVYINTEKRIKVSKKYVKIDTQHPNVDGTYPVLSILDKRVDDNLLGVFVTTDLEGFRIPQITHVSEFFPNILD